MVWSQLILIKGNIVRNAYHMFHLLFCPEKATHPSDIPSYVCVGFAFDIISLGEAAITN